MGDIANSDSRGRRVTFSQDLSHCRSYIEKRYPHLLDAFDSMMAKVTEEGGGTQAFTPISILGTKYTAREKEVFLLLLRPMMKEIGIIAEDGTEL